jgi:hypothetical protein
MQGMRGKRLRKICSQMSLQRSDVRGAMISPAYSPATSRSVITAGGRAGAAVLARRASLSIIQVL